MFVICLTQWSVSSHLLTYLLFTFHFVSSLVTSSCRLGHSDVSSVLPSLFLFVYEERQRDDDSLCTFYFSLANFNPFPLQHKRGVHDKSRDWAFRPLRRMFLTNLFKVQNRLVHLTVTIQSELWSQTDLEFIGGPSFLLTRLYFPFEDLTCYITCQKLIATIYYVTIIPPPSKNQSIKPTNQLTNNNNVSACIKSTKL